MASGFMKKNFKDPFAFKGFWVLCICAHPSERQEQNCFRIWWVLKGTQMCDQASLVESFLASVDSGRVLEGAFPSSALGEHPRGTHWPLLRVQFANLSVIDSESWPILCQIIHLASWHRILPCMSVDLVLHVTQVSLKFRLFLPLPPKYRDDRHTAADSAYISSMSACVFVYVCGVHVCNFDDGDVTLVMCVTPSPITSYIGTHFPSEKSIWLKWLNMVFFGFCRVFIVPLGVDWWPLLSLGTRWPWLTGLFLFWGFQP